MLFPLPKSGGKQLFLLIKHFFVVEPKQLFSQLAYPLGLLPSPPHSIANSHHIISHPTPTPKNDLAIFFISSYHLTQPINWQINQVKLIG